MTNRYKIALAVGTSIGLLSIFLSAIAPLWSIKALAPWQIPHWDRFSNFQPGQMLDLEHKAVFLRMCLIALKYGFWYLLIPNLLTCALGKVDELGERSVYFWCLSKSILISVPCVFGLAFLWGMTAGLYDSGTPPYLEAQLLEGVGITVFFLLCATSFIGPAFWLLVFVMLMVRKKQQTALPN